MLPTSRERLWADPLSEKQVCKLWVGNGLKLGTIAIYKRFLGVFFAYCNERRLVPAKQLTARGAADFCSWYLKRGREPLNRQVLRKGIRPPLRAYAWALSTVGCEVPLWAPLTPKKQPPRIISKYIGHMREHRGCTESTLARNATDLEPFVAYLERGGRDRNDISLRDIDRYLLNLARRCSPASVGRAACSIRSWLRFVYGTGQMKHDLASAVVAPVRRPLERPPRALPWSSIKRLLRSTEQTSHSGYRDRAQFLLMSAYGLGAAEVLHLRLEDIDWHGRRLHVVRRKTKRTICLPLLWPVAKALADYIRRARPRPTQSRHVFLSRCMPFKPIAQTSTLCDRVRRLVRRAGVKTDFHGTHLFRHSHATRQVVLGTSMKTLGDILGHGDPATTSIYVRAAVQRLRRLALPVPR